MSSKNIKKQLKMRIQLMKNIQKKNINLDDFRSSFDTKNREHFKRLNSLSINQNNELCPIGTSLNSSSPVQNNNIVDNSRIGDFDDEHSNEVASIDNFSDEDSFISSQMTSFDITTIIQNLNDDESTQQLDQRIEHIKLYLLLFLQQSRGDLSDHEVAIQARSHRFIYDDDDIPLCYETLKKRGRIFQPEVFKYLYSKCGLIGPLTPAQITSNEEVFCSKICSCPIIPSQQMESYFCYIKLKDYLQNVIPKIFGLLRFNKALPTEQPAEIIHDIVDGSRYRKLAGPDTIMIYFGFDGVQYSVNPPKKSIWPLVIYICELPFDLRQKFAFPLAIHSGQSQPKNIMLEPFINELSLYFREKIKFAIKDPNGNGIQTRELNVKLLLAICDAPARAKVLNMIQHNGYYGCNFCKILAKQHDELNCLVYPMNCDFELRTDKEWRDLANKADQVRILKSNDRDFGIKGSTPLMKLPYLDMVTACPPEFMHSQFLGTVKLLLAHWMGNRMADMTLDVETLNRRLKLLKFPSKILRVMPDITKPTLKSIELENLLYYGFVLFIGLLPDEEFQNFKLLSLIISTLSSRNITQNQINKCEEWIKIFICDFGRIYPTELHKYNVHMLCHLPQVVRAFGPLITNSAYQVENLMGKIAKQVQTEVLVPEQTMNKTCVISSSVVNFFANIKRFSEKFTNYILKEFFPFLMEDREKLTVGAKSYTMTPVERYLLSTIDDIEVTTRTKVHQIDKITLNKFIVSTNEYSCKNNELTNNQYIKTKSGKYLKVISIMRVKDNVYLFGNEFINLKQYVAIEGAEFQHVKYTEAANESNILQIIKSSEIDCPFSLIFLNHNYILFDLFNRHI